MFICFASSIGMVLLTHHISGMSHLWNIPDDAPQAENEIVLETYEDPLDTASKALIFSKENCKENEMSLEYTCICKN